MNGYGYQIQKDAVDYRNMAEDFVNGLESWLMNGIDDMMLLCRDFAKPINANGFEYFKAACAVTLQYALKSLSADTVQGSEASALLNKSVLDEVQVAIWQNNIEPDAIISLANQDSDNTDVAEGA